jgi:hypothetical protein
VLESLAGRLWEVDQCHMEAGKSVSTDLIIWRRVGVFGRRSLISRSLRSQLLSVYRQSIRVPFTHLLASLDLCQPIHGS